jgi:hypothetical protein
MIDPPPVNLAGSGIQPVKNNAAPIKRTVSIKE